MSNVSKSQREDKIRSQMAELFAKLTLLESDGSMGISNFLMNRGVHYKDARDRANQKFNIRKKIEFLKRKLTKLEGM